MDCLIRIRDSRCYAFRVIDTGEELHQWISELFPLSRSIVGPGYDESLYFLTKKLQKSGRILTFPTGSAEGGWVVPNSWKLNRAQILDNKGKKIISTDDSNLHVWSHSTSFVGRVSRKQLENHLLTLERFPKAIPYGTTYYRKNWGFSLTYEQYLKLQDDEYFIEIDVDEQPGALKVFELVLKGRSKKEVFFSTYLCHPSMANNELSGPALIIALIRMLEKKDLNYTYRFVIAPETIGPIFYLSKLHEYLRTNTHAAFNLTCVGAGDNWSFLGSRTGKTYTDFIAETLLSETTNTYERYNFLDRGSDERQYCSPAVSLPMVSIMRSMYQHFDEYHNSMDNLDFVTAERLQETLDFYGALLNLIESDGIYFNSNVGESFLDKKLNYPPIGGRTEPKGHNFFTNVKNFLAIADKISITDVCRDLNITTKEALEVINFCLENDLVEKNLF